MQSLLFVLALNLALIAPSLHVVERGYYVMGSSLTFTLYCRDRALCVEAISEAHEEVKRLDRIFSNYRSDSVLATVHANARAVPPAPVPVPKEFIDLVMMANRYSALTRGAFDITAAPLIELWKSRGEGRGLPPTPREIAHAKACVGAGKITLSPKRGTVFLNTPCMLLDFGGIGKGYAVDRVIDVLRARGVSVGIVDFGGNIYAMRPPPGEDGWVVGVRHPEHPNRAFTKIKISNAGVATSGDYERFITIGGKRYSHIIDPRTGYPVRSVPSVTVLAGSAVEADALSTAFTVMGEGEVREAIGDWAHVGVLMLRKGANGELSVFKSKGFSERELGE